MGIVLDTQQQLDAINRIMGKTEKGTLGTYYLRGKTYMFKSELKNWGWKWDREEKAWFIEDVYENDSSLRAATGLENTFIERI